MCIVVDPPSFVPMFKQDDPEHPKFLPVKNWVINGPGRLVIGGTKYREELKAVASILRVITELSRTGKVIVSPDEQVNAEEKAVKIIEPNKDFDDPHLVALIRLTGCKLVCIRDPRAHKYLRSARFYGSLKQRPRLYTREKNSNILCIKNIPPKYR